MVDGWSDVVENAKFQMLRSNYPQVQIGAQKFDFFILIILRGWGVFMVNGWSDVVEDAKFEMLRSNYP